MDADKVHRPLFPRFTCTTPRPHSTGGRTLRHPKPWEHEVQAHIRQLKPPVHGAVVLIGIRSADIAAVAMFSYQMAPTMPVVVIQALAVAMAYRNQGGRVADAAIETVLQRAATDLDARGYRKALAVGRVAHANVPSQALMIRHGFTSTGARTDQLQEWIQPIAW